MIWMLHKILRHRRVFAGNLLYSDAVKLVIENRAHWRICLTEASHGSKKSGWCKEGRKNWLGSSRHEFLLAYRLPF